MSLHLAFLGLWATISGAFVAISSTDPDGALGISEEGWKNFGVIGAIVVVVGAFIGYLRIRDKSRDSALHKIVQAHAESVETITSRHAGAMERVGAMHQEYARKNMEMVASAAMDPVRAMQRTLEAHAKDDSRAMAALTHEISLLPDRVAARLERTP